MECQIFYIAQIASIDERLDELIEDYGDLPEQIKVKESHLSEKKMIVDDTQSMLDDFKNFISKAKVTLVDLKTREEKLTQQQFQVRNNKEFDAITNEINHLKTEHEKLSDELRTSGVKIENLANILSGQTKEMEKAKVELDEVYVEVQRLAGDQNDELDRLKNLRKKLIVNLKSKFHQDYDRIRTMHSDAAVRIKKSSCSGCFSFLPAQQIVEVRNNLGTLYFCESCGRILIPEDLYIEDVI